MGIVPVTAMMDFMVQAPRAIADIPVARHLQAWLHQHRPRLLDFHEDADHFGNLLMILTKQGLDVRFVADRGDLLVDVGQRGLWVSERLLDAFMRDVPVSQGRPWPEFDPFVHPGAVLRALTQPGLQSFLHTANVQALESIGFAVAAH